MILRNREGLTQFDIPEYWYGDRVPGLSGLVRLRDEETWVAEAIRSFLPWCDELIIVVQPSIDRTREIVAAFATDPKVRLFDYPFLSHPNGPGHDECPPESVRSLEYYYNWTLAKSTRSHAVKLDGDMIMQDFAGHAIRKALAKGHDRIQFSGIDLVGETLDRIGSHPDCPTDGVFRVTPDVEYRTGKLSERLSCGQPVTHEIREPAFVHLKWARKPVSSQTKLWPANWREIEHFQRLYGRRIPIAPYTGAYPSGLRSLL